MATKYYSDGTYTKGDGKLYRPGIGVVGKDGSTAVSKAEGGTSSNTTSSNKTGSTITTMRGTGSSSSSKSYADTLKEKVTSSVKNPSNGVYSSLSNNSLVKDMVTAYNQSTGSNAKVPSVTSKPVVEEVIEEVEEKELYNPYEDKYNELKEAYDRQEELLREQNRLAVEQGVNRLNAQKSNINQSADENARQAYVNFMQSQKALPQQLASQGVTGGATETANLGLQTAYQNNVNTINQNKVNRLQEIDNAIVDLQNTGDLSTVEQVLANNQMALDAYMNTFDKGVSYNQWAQQFNANRADTLAEQAYRDKVYADNMIQQDRENQWYEQSYKDKMAQQQLENEWYERNYSDSKKQEETNTVINLLENGLVDVNYASTLLGVPVDQLNNFVNYINKARNLELSNTQSLISNRNSSGSSGGSSGSTKTNQTYTQVLNAIQGLNTTAGADYTENLASARYLLNSDLPGEDKVRIMKQTNVRPEAYVKQMVEQGYSIEDVGAFVDAYTPNEEYREALIKYAYQR